MILTCLVCTALLYSDLPPRETPNLELPLLRRVKLDFTPAAMVSLKEATRVLAGDSHKIALIDLEMGRMAWEFDFPHQKWMAVAENADRFCIAGRGDSPAIYVGRLKDGKETRLLKGHTDDITGLALSNDGKRAVSTSNDGTARVWDVEAGRELFRYKTHAHPKAPEKTKPFANGVGACFAKNLAVTGEDDHHAYLWDVRDGRIQAKLGPLERRGEHAFFDSKGTMVYVTDMSGQVLACEVQTGKVQGSLMGHRETVTRFRILPGDRRAVSTDRTSRILFWDLESRKALGQFRTAGGYFDPVLMDVSSDGRKVLVVDKMFIEIPTTKTATAIEIRSLEKLPK